MEIQLSNGDLYELPENSSGIELARKLKKRITGTALALRINGELKDLKTPLKERDTAEVITFESDEGKAVFWHSTAHLLAQAVKRLYPRAQPTIGPAIESGFYYDFANLQISRDDFPKIEEEMRKIVQERYVPERLLFSSTAEALQEFAENPFKKEMIEQLEEGVSAYRQGEFIDLCRGPHIPQLGLIQAFKIMKTSGAYWRANKNNEQLTRIYGISYPDKKQLAAYLHLLEEAKKRDHKVIGKQLKLFSFHQEAPGMPFFHPNGMLLWDELMKYWEECHAQDGYHKIKTPMLMTKELWEISGHWENFRENMYLAEVDEHPYVVKPMNCPGGMLYFKEGQYSYRQLPLRIAEIGNVHRHELSGALSGLFRVRSFHQDDAHIFMKPEDMRDEIHGVLSLTGKMYKTFGLEFHLELSTRPEKAIGTSEQWEQSTDILKLALQDAGHDFIINEGDGAFYGPKIDIHIKDAIGRTWQCGTIQLDMMLPERFDLSYIGQDGNKQRPIMIHRVIYGSIERFLGILVEHFAGKFPLWMAPQQVRILPITDAHHQYARQVKKQFNQASLRVAVDDSTESISKKVRLAQLDQVNYILVVGDREIAENSVTVRADNKVKGASPVTEVISSLLAEIKTRALRKQACLS